MTLTEQKIFEILQKHTANYKTQTKTHRTIACSCGAEISFRPGESAGTAHRHHVTKELAGTSVWKHVVVYIDKK